MAWIEPVTNRTLDDVLARNELGVLNASDLNRIDGNMQELAKKLGVTIAPAKNWTNSSIPVVSDYERIINSTKAVRSALKVPEPMPEVPTMPLNSFDKYNAIEKIQLMLYTQYRVLQDAKIFAGDGYYSGDKIGVI